MAIRIQILLLSMLTFFHCTQTLIFKPKEWFRNMNVFTSETYSITHIEVSMEQSASFDSLRMTQEFKNGTNDASPSLVNHHFEHGFKNQRQQRIVDTKKGTKQYIESVLANILGKDSVFLIPFKAYAANRLIIEGINIFGVLKGPQYNKPNDPILLLSAHWDTFPGSAGVDDDASGTIAVLELSRLLQKRRSSIPFTVYFVLFDLKEYGLIGSYAFVNNYLRPKVAKGLINVIAGFNFDGILNYNASHGSQTFTLNITHANVNINRNQPFKDTSYINVDSTQVSGIQRSGSKGDFICVQARVNHDNAIIASIRKAFNSLQHNLAVKLRVFKVKLPKQGSLDVLTNYNTKYPQFLQSDHLNFWYTFAPSDGHEHNERNQNNFTIPAVLFTDTGILRGIQQNCFHKLCDSSAQLNDDNYEFMVATVRTVNKAIDLLSQSYTLVERNKVNISDTITNDNITTVDEMLLKEEQLQHTIILLVIAILVVSSLLIGVYNYSDK